VRAASVALLPAGSDRGGQNSDFLEWELRSPFPSLNSSRIPRFLSAERRERRSRPSRRPLWGTQDFHINLQTPTLWTRELRSPCRSRNSSRIPGFFSAERRERRSRPSRRRLWETQDFHIKRQTPTFLEWEPRFPFPSRNSSRIPGFFRAERRERRSRPSRRQLWETQGSIHTFQTPIFWSGSYALHVGVGIHRVFPGFSALNGESGALDPPDANSGRRKISTSALKLRFFGSGSYASRFQVEFHRVFSGISTLNGESGALALQTPTLGDAGFPYQASNSDVFGVGATLPVSKSSFIAYSQAFSAER